MLQPHSGGVEIQDLPCSIIKDKYMMKAQVHVSKSSAISDEQALPQRKHHLQTSSAVVSLYLGRGNLSSLAVGKSSGSGNSSLADKIDLKGFQSSKPCEVCHIAKQTRDPFPQTEHKTSSLGQSDCGGINSSSADPVVESASAYPTSTADLYASTSNKEEGHTIRRSGRKYVLPSKFKDYVVDGKGKYGINTVVNNSDLSYDNFSFITSLYKTFKPRSFKEVILDSKWVDAINCKDLGNLKYFLGIDVIKNDQGVCLSERKYSPELLSEFRMLACKPSKIPLYVSKYKNKPVKLVDGDEKFLDNITGYQKLVGKLIYLTITRLDISYVVHKLSQVMHAPKFVDMKSAFKVLRSKRDLLIAQGMVKGLDQTDNPNQVCEGCLFGKHTRSSFSKEATSRAKKPLQLIHTDLCGPITPSSYDNKSPQKAWNGLKPTVSYLWVFGSIAYVHVLHQRLLKLDDRSEKHVFVGYDKQLKGYKLYNPVTRKVVASRDVEFDEEGSWDWSIQESERQVMEEEIKTIEKNDTWELTTLLKGQKAIGVKWVYKAKKNAKGKVEKYKARIMAKVMDEHLCKFLFFDKGLRRSIENMVQKWLPLMLSWPRGPNLGCYKTTSYMIVACVFVARHVFGEHDVHCNKLLSFKYQHDMVRDVLFDGCMRVWISGKKEAQRNACVDLTGVSPLMGLSSQSFTVGQTALKAASCKVTKHKKACIKNQHVFVPLAFDTFGFLAPKAVELLNKVQRVMHIMSRFLERADKFGEISYEFARIYPIDQKDMVPALRPVDFRVPIPSKVEIDRSPRDYTPP
nr:copia-type polyprotein [Tanacetum cinerariifolium]